MHDVASTPYDTLLYPGYAMEQAHPDRLATLATLFGMTPADVSRCRVLELGCGDGLHLVAVALGLPDAECVGIDLAAAGLRKGQAAIRELGITNITLRHMDLMEVGRDFGQFDFIIAHGIYSWVPPHVRDKLLAICRENLAAHGVAYVSYNAYPGSHFRDMVRGMMRYHVSELTDPTQRVEQARALIRFLAESDTEPNLYKMVLKKEWERIAAFRDSSLFHDDLAEYNTPVYFYQFMEHAARHDLQYLAEAEFVEMQTGILPLEVVGVLHQMADSLIAQEQYLDFFRCRRFRQTLLCHAEHQLDRMPRPEKMADFYIASPVRPDPAELDRQAGHTAAFLGPKNSVLKTDQPLIQAALMALHAAWPQALHFDVLLDTARAACGRNVVPGEPWGDEDVDILGDALLRAYAGGVIELHVHPPRFVLQPGERPIASPLARLQSREGSRVTTLHHHNVAIEDALGRHFLQLLDGTRDRAALLDDLVAFMASGGASSPRNDQPVEAPQAVRQRLAAELERKLAELARLALFVG
jgi:methyltransferase-like protein